jgi:hypothetical protein
VKKIVRGVFATAVFVAIWAACNVPAVHIFIAGQYLAEYDCVTPGEAVDILDGLGSDAACDATCIVPEYEAGVYITGACAPFPPGDLVNPDAAPYRQLCAKGLAAIHRSDLCLDGGPSNPAMDSGMPVAIDAGAHDAGAQPGSSDAGAHDSGSAGHVSDAAHD